MEIQSSLNSGVQGFNKAQDDVSKAASAIAANVIEPVNTQTTTNNTENKDVAVSQTNLSQEVVNLKIAEHQASASVNVIRSADENLGTLLDVRV